MIVRANGILIGGAAIVAVLLMAVWADPSRAEQHGKASEGRSLYLKYCASCHGLDGKGHGPVAKDLKTSPADLTQISSRRGGVFPEVEIMEMIDGRREVTGHGSREMPVWGERLVATEAASTTGAKSMARKGQLMVLVTYLQSIQK